MILVCGRFEGVDERVIEARGLEEVSIGDYVLSGGEIAAFVLLDACVRLLPGVMGKADLRRRKASPRGCWSTAFTVRRCSRASRSPDVLLSGDHAKIAVLAAGRGGEGSTKTRRPDLWAPDAVEKPPRKGAATARGDKPPVSKVASPDKQSSLSRAVHAV